jgi:hypothetical protein
MSARLLLGAGCVSDPPLDAQVADLADRQLGRVPVEARHPVPGIWKDATTIGSARTLASG